MSPCWDQVRVRRADSVGATAETMTVRGAWGPIAADTSKNATEAVTSTTAGHTAPHSLTTAEADSMVVEGLRAVRAQKP